MSPLAEIRPATPLEKETVRFRRPTNPEESRPSERKGHADKGYMEFVREIFDSIEQEGVATVVFKGEGSDYEVFNETLRLRRFVKKHYQIRLQIVCESTGPESKDSYPIDQIKMSKMFVKINPYFEERASR